MNKLHFRPSEEGRMSKADLTMTEEHFLHSGPDFSLSKKMGNISDNRLAKYLASGSFMDTRPLRQEKSVQRNKAIFMVLFVVMVAYVVMRLVV